MARMSHQVMTLTQALKWAESRDLKHLSFLIRNNVACARIGSVTKLELVKAALPKPQELTIMSHAQLSLLVSGEYSGEAKMSFNDGQKAEQEMTAEGFQAKVKYMQDEEAKDAYERELKANKAQRDFDAAKAEEAKKSYYNDTEEDKETEEVKAPKATPVASNNAGDMFTQMINDAVAKCVDKAAIGESVNTIVQAEIAKICKITVIEVVQPDKPPVTLGVQHNQFPLLLDVCNARTPEGHHLNIWLVGPAGTGKTSAAGNVAKALDMPFHFNSAIDTKYELLGFIDAMGKPTMTPFRRAWTEGGVYLFDEVSASSEQAVLAFNGALANGKAPFPDATLDRHPDCIIIAGDNTHGQGATVSYNGRNKMDAAFLDRFVFIDWPIDEVLERVICGNDNWFGIVSIFRKRVAEAGIRDFEVTPRASIYGASLIRQGMPLAKVATLVLKKALPADKFKELTKGLFA